jgi:hypothetical protein
MLHSCPSEFERDETNLTECIFQDAQADSAAAAGETLQRPCRRLCVPLTPVLFFAAARSSYFVEQFHACCKLTMLQKVGPAADLCPLCMSLVCFADSPDQLFSAL